MIYFAFSYFKLLNICFLKKFKYRLFPNHDLGVNVVARDNAVVGLCLLSFAKLLRDELINSICRYKYYNNSVVGHSKPSHQGPLVPVRNTTATQGGLEPFVLIP
jgi:hypothetical protein